MGGAFTEEDCSIQDYLGNRYRAEVFERPGALCVVVYDGDVPVGHANCVIKRDVLDLEDLHVADDAIQPAHGLPLVFRNLFNRRAKGVNYRSRGLGTAMLRLLITRASSHGFRVIEGSLSPHDLAKDPGLPDWYRRRGFTLLSEGNRGQAKVQLQIHRNPSDGPPQAFAS